MMGERMWNRHMTIREANCDITAACKLFDHFVNFLSSILSL